MITDQNLGGGGRVSICGNIFQGDLPNALQSLSLKLHDQIDQQWEPQEPPPPRLIFVANKEQVNCKA